MTNLEQEAEEYAAKHTWDIPTRGAAEREEAVKIAYMAGHKAAIRRCIEEVTRWRVGYQANDAEWLVKTLKTLLPEAP